MSHGPLSVARPPRLFTPVALLLAFTFVSPAPARAQSAVDAFNPGTDGSVNAVAVALDGKTYVGGSFSTLGGGTRSNFGRLNNDGTLDTGFVFDVNGAVYTIVNALSGDLLVGGQFTSVTTLSGTTPCNGLMRLNPFDGTLDTCFSGGATLSLGIVNTIAVQRDRKVVVGGSFTLLAGQPRSNIGRFNSDGTLDVSFNPGATATVFAAVVQQNGQIVIGGNFTQVGGPSASFPATSRNHIARLNADGSLDTSYNPGADATVLTAALQNDGRIVVGGTFTKLGGGTGTTPRAAIGRINRDGSLDIPFDPGTDGSVRAVTQLPDGDILVGGTFTTLGGASRANLGRVSLNGTIAPFNSATNSTVQGVAALLDGRIVIGGLFTTVGPFPRSTLARLYDNGAVDATLNPGANASPAALAQQLDGRILVGGDFTMMGNGGTLARSHLARLSPDGSVDAFNPGPTDAVWSLLVQPDGMIVVGGIFNSISSFPHSKLARINAAGADDASFTPSANSRVLALAIQSDQKILVGGEFTQFGGTGSVMSSRQRLVRLNPDGTVDATFPTTVDEAVYGIAVQPDGKILIVGLFTQVNGPTGPVIRNHIARLNQDGSVDSSFNAFADSAVTGVSVQPDGTIFVFGAFAKVNNISKSGIARLSDAGLLDASFTGGANGEITSIQVQTDGNVIVGGVFTELTDAIGSTPRQNLGRFFSNGIVDTTFNPGADLPVRALLLQPDGKLTVAGMFNTLGGNTRARIGRLRGPALAALQFMAVSQAGVLWFRGLGATSQFSRVTLSLSTNGTSFTPLDDPTPNVIGWNLASTSLPVNQNVFVRARGFTTQGYANASESIVQWTQNAYIACPVIAPAAIPAGRVGSPYSVSFSSSFALGVVTFTETGALPSGVTFVNGVLSGTPAESGNFPITVDATDSWSGCVRSQAVTLAIAPPPTLSLSPVRVNFGAVRAATGAWISQTPAQTVTIVQNGSGVLPWTASANQPWIQVSLPSGVGGGALTVSIVNTGALPSSGAIAGAILVATSDANYTLPVLLTILPGTNTGPIGSFDTPLNGQTGVTGSFAVTGWAVDDIGVSAVRVCRAAVAGEAAGVQPLCGNRPEVFIGNATFVAGARPDIAASYPDLPYFDRAGWGYLLLSNFLPGQGNGPYVITTYAEDFDGHVTALGAKAINCSNATATAPFGAIDTPDQGGVMSGAGFPNFGWVLAAQPTSSGRFIPFDGSTIQVFIDSVFVSGVDSYNNPRPDIQALFPGYANTDGAVGVKILDSTPIANGVHTIFWIAVDNFGAAAGIGSRFFTVSNSSVVAASGSNSPPLAISAQGLSAAAVIVRYGFDANPRTEVVAPNADGVREVHAHQLDRIAIDLRAHSDTGETTYQGYARVGDALHALPIGSHLDERTGEFAWAPGLAFGGPHELIFIKTSAHGSERIDIRVVVR